MKKIISMITSMALCILFALSVSAAEAVYTGEEAVSFTEEAKAARATNYFTGSTVKMNSLYGKMSAISNISSGSVIGTDPRVTSVSLSVTVSSGSDSFKLYVEDPNGNYDYETVTRSGTVTFTSFNGINPYGKWKVYIVTDGTVSTATARMKVTYSY